MILSKPTVKKLTLFIVSFVVFSVIKISAQDGKALFQSKCASCHNVFRDATGPKLGGVLDGETYGGDIKKVYNWIRHTTSLTATDPHYKALKAQFQSQMTEFTESALSDKDIDAIFAYVEKTYKTPPETSNPNSPGGSGDESNNAVIFGVISLILAIIALILMQVNSNLKKLSDDSEGIHRPEPVPFYKNKIYIAIVSLIFFVIAGFYFSKVAIGFGRQVAYEPKQPIFYSHKVHAGINQINCLYCHGNAWDSKSAAIPSVNVCMNCHKTIQTYEKGPKLYDGDGNEINGSEQILKLYEYAGFDPKNANSWDPSKAKPIEWTKIHNLPDHVFFSHAQHIRAGKVQCQTCHGEITAMDEVRQVSELSMGWCINCHRQTKVDFNYSDSTGNKFYSLYEKFHNDLKPDTLKNAKGEYVLDDNGNYTIRAPKMDSVTVKDIGGLECQKCHY